MAESLQHQTFNQTGRQRLSSACYTSSTGNELEFSEDETLDPRIKVELEKLNNASAEINKLELQLDDGRSSFRQILTESIQKLNLLAKKLGSCVDKARPYYEARQKANENHMETHKAALRYERACSMHEAAKEMFQLAEQGYQKRERGADPAWQEMLNHATMKVNEAECERLESEMDHQKAMKSFKESESQVQYLQKELKRSINKSKPYFEMKARFNQILEDQKGTVSRLEEDILSYKALYSQALHSLENISDEIHKNRIQKQKTMELGEREAGVGAESPVPSRHQSNKIEGCLDEDNAGTEVFLPPNVDLHKESKCSIHNSYNLQPKQVNPGMKENIEVSLNEDSIISIKPNTSSNIQCDDVESITKVNREIMKPENAHVEVKSVQASTTSKHKLKGLILGVSNNNDSRVYKETYSVNKTLYFDEKKDSASSNEHESKATPLPVSQENHDLYKEIQNLKVLDTNENMDENSDSESVLSAGPMLDDDQVYLLSLNFSGNEIGEETS